jgi:hypothetical protein
MNSLTTTSSGTNGETSAHDLFLLSDEQILEIEAEAQDIEIADVYLDDADRAVLVTPASLPAELDRASGGENRRLEAGATDGGLAADQADEGVHAAESIAATSRQPQVTGHDVSVPPQWLVDRMSDPQAGSEARALWDSVQQSRAEAAGFREIFAKPEEARAAAQRARLLDDIDRAYFGGDTTQRASLAASMLREDPAAFREMVFAGLRALEEGAQSPFMRGDASPRTQQVTAGDAAGNSVSSASPSSPAHDAFADPQRGSLTSHAALARPHELGRDSAERRAVAPPPPSAAAEHSAAAEPSTHRIASDSARDARHPDGNSSREANRSPDRTTDLASRQTSSSTDAATTDHIATNYAAFERSTNNDLERLVGGTIDRTLERALPHSNRADSTAMRTRLAASIRQDIERSLQGDRQLGEQVAQVLSARRLDEATRSQVVRLIGERAQQMVPATTRRVLGDWTQTTLAAHRERGGRADASLSHREVERATPSPARSTAAATTATNAPSASHSPATSQRGTSSGRSTQPVAPRTQKLDYRRVSDEQILDG